MRARSAAHCEETTTDELQPSYHLATVRPLHSEKHLPEREEALEETWLVGSFFWTLEKGDVWLLGSESAFLFTDC